MRRVSLTTFLGLVLLVIFSLLSHLAAEEAVPEGADRICPYGALWDDASGGKIVVLRQGLGRAKFIKGAMLVAIALELQKTEKDGSISRTTIWGPSRSNMFFGPDVVELDSQGFTWSAPSFDESGFYVVKDDAGHNDLMAIKFIKCLE